MEITQVVDPVIDEPVGTIRFDGASGTLGETPPLYRLQLKTEKHPILLGEKDTRHHFVRHVTGVRVDGGKVVLVPEISISYPRSVSSGGIVFNAEEDQISRLGVIVPDIRVPADNPTASQYAMDIRLGGRGLWSEELAKASLQPLGPAIVLVMPTGPGPTPAIARVLWFTLDPDGSFVIDRS